MTQHYNLTYIFFFIHSYFKFEVKRMGKQNSLYEVMVLLLDENSEHIKIILFGQKNHICDCSRTNLMT